MEKNDYVQAEATLTHYLTTHKLRNTTERRKVLEYIYSHEGHFTAQSLHEDLNADFRVSLATVYSALELFTKLNLVAKHQFSSECVEYERFSANQTHHHRICTQCGQVKEFTDLKIRRSINNRSFTAFEISHFSLYVYGVCKKCQRKMKLKQKK